MFAPGALIIEQNDEQIIQSARFLALLHQKTANLVLPHKRKPYTIETMLHEPLRAIRPAFEKFGYREGYSWLQSLSGKLLQNLEEINIEKFSRGYCHYDFMSKNWHHDAKGAITLFDFDSGTINILQF